MIFTEYWIQEASFLEIGMEIRYRQFRHQLTMSSKSMYIYRDHRTLTLSAFRAQKELSSDHISFFRTYSGFRSAGTGNRLSISSVTYSDVNVLRNYNVRYNLNNILDDDMMRDWF